MKATRHRLAAVALTILVSCGAPAIEGDLSNSKLTGYAQAGCAPTDAPAVEIYLADAPPPRSEAAAWMDSVAMLRTLPESQGPAGDGEATLARILVWRDAIELVGQEFLLSGGVMDWGDVTWCSAQGCEAIPEGRLRLILAEPSEIVGEYELAAPDGDVLVGSLQAVVVEREFGVLCG